MSSERLKKVTRQVLLAENDLFVAYQFLPHTKEQAGTKWKRAIKELQVAKEDYQKSVAQDVLDEDRATDEGMPEESKKIKKIYSSSEGRT